MKLPLLKAKCIDNRMYNHLTEGGTYYVRESSYSFYEVYRSKDEDSFISCYSKRRFELIKEPMIKVKCTSVSYTFIQCGITYLAVEESDSYYNVYDLDEKMIGCYSKKNFTIVVEETEVEIITRKLKESEELANKLKKELEVAKLREKHNNNSLIGVDIDALNECIDGDKFGSLFGCDETFKVRSAGEYKNLAFYLSGKHSWKIVTDSTGAQVLVPTKID